MKHVNQSQHCLYQGGSRFIDGINEISSKGFSQDGKNEDFVLLGATGCTFLFEGFQNRNIHSDVLWLSVFIDDDSYFFETLLLWRCLRVILFRNAAIWLML